MTWTYPCEGCGRRVCRTSGSLCDACDRPTCDDCGREMRSYGQGYGFACPECDRCDECGAPGDVDCCHGGEAP